MAVPSLPKLKPLKLTKLQALLLLGGAFVLAAAAWTAFTYRLVSEPDWADFSDASAVLTVYGNATANRKFIGQLTASSSDTIDLANLGPKSAVTFSAIPDPENGSLKIHASASAKPTHLRLIPRDAQASGFVSIVGRRQPLFASFDQEKAVFRIGQTYRGLFEGGAETHSVRRMITTSPDQLAYLEKPADVSWMGPTSLLAKEMEHFPGLTSLFSLPGRVEFTLSASESGTALQPFGLYYRPAGGQTVPKGQIETYARELLSEAVPHAIDVKLPDGTHMQELRHDPGSVQSSVKPNQFGDIEKFTVPDQKSSLSAFFTKDGEAWLTTDVLMLQGIFMANVGAVAPVDECHAGGAGGYMAAPGSYLPVPNSFKTVTVSIHNLETGLFTICGYY